ncbi:hypothetical protein [Algicella marina]|uniref:Uncharacterized protein n=1 Tax=Algicella marina TaxID=2683284 RepID=A0A6P1T274_9RHOB|nr:hypothetical protein [Algicella marina]QHQ36097.1 hypothetical protein GO499_13385 [Algicella marina]
MFRLMGFAPNGPVAMTFEAWGDHEIAEAGEFLLVLAKLEAPEVEEDLLRLMEEVPGFMPASPTVGTVAELRLQTARHFQQLGQAQIALRDRCEIVMTLSCNSPT